MDMIFKNQITLELEGYHKKKSKYEIDSFSFREAARSSGKDLESETWEFQGS